MKVKDLSDKEINNLIYRVDRFIVLKNEGYLSIYMVLELINGLSKHFNTSFISISELWNEREKIINVESSSVYFDVELKK